MAPIKDFGQGERYQTSKLPSIKRALRFDPYLYKCTYNEYKGTRKAFDSYNFKNSQNFQNIFSKSSKLLLRI